MIRILMPRLLRDFMEWRPDAPFIFGLWTGLAISWIIIHATAWVIWKYDLQPSPSMAIRRIRKRVCPECGKRLETSEGEKQ